MTRARSPSAPTPTLLSWSGGKDSAVCLHELLRDPAVEVAGLLTTVTAGYDRISVHGVRRSLLEMQADALDLPLTVVEIPPDCTNERYEERFGTALAGARREGIRDVAYGDLRLGDVRAYRERLTEAAGLKSSFPVWERDTTQFARRVVGLGFRAVLVCVDGDALDSEFVGREYDRALLEALPAGVDPCGENGEFHTFVYDGPGFSGKIPVKRGERVVRDDRFVYQDLVPG